MYKAFVPKGKGNIHRGSGPGKSSMAWYNGMYGNWSWFSSGAMTFFNDKGLGKNKDKGKGMGKGKNKDKGKENRKDKGMGKDQGRQEEAAEVCDSHWSDDEEAEAACGGGAAAPSATNCARPARAMSSSRDAAAIATGAVAALPPAWERGRERGVRER